MVDHPFERLPARPHAVRPFARPTEDAAAPSTRGPWAGRPTPFVSPAIPEPNAAAPASQDFPGTEPAPTDGGSPTNLEAADRTPPEYPRSLPDLPSVDAPSGDHVPYPSWATLMEERADADQEPSARPRPDTGDESLDQLTPADVAASDDRTRQRMADDFWADSSDQADSEHAGVSSAVGGHDLQVMDLDDHDVEATGRDVPILETARTDQDEASSGAQDEATDLGTAAPSPPAQPRADHEDRLREGDPDDGEQPETRSEIDATMLLDDIDLSGVTSRDLKRLAEGAEPARDEPLMSDLESAGDYGELAAIDGDVVAPDDAVLAAAHIAAPVAGEVVLLADHDRRESAATASGDVHAHAGGGEMAAAVLERLAGRLRRGELTLPDAGPRADDALTVAHVLTALLDTSRQASHGELPPPTMGTEL
jgi:hypothetical protein